MQIILTREHISVPWGFRLKGGAEYNVPLSILKVNEGSPSHFKLECGDVIASIGNFSALNLKHEEALNIIRMFDVSLPLIVHRDQSINFNQQYKSSPTWRPQSVSSSNVVKSINSYQQNNSYSSASSSPNHISYHHLTNSPNSYSSQLVYNSSGVSPASPTKTQSSFLNQNSTNITPSYFVDNQTPLQAYEHAHCSSQQKNVNHPQAMIGVQQNTNASYQLPPPPPPAPPLPTTGFASPNSYRTNQNQANTKNNTSTVESASASSYSATKQAQNQNVPDALLKAMNGSGMSKKPFTYTPGGLDLSHVRESARVKRYEAMQNLEHQHHSATLNRQSSFNQPHHYNQQSSHSYHSNDILPSLSSSFQRHSSLARNTSASISNLSTFERDNSLSSVTREYVPQSSEKASYKTNVVDSTTNLYEYKNNNGISNTPKIPISSTLAKKVSSHYNQPTGGFNITPDQLVKPKRDENRDLWIEESESNNISLKSKKDEEEIEKEDEKEKAALRKSEVVKAIEEEEQKSVSSNILAKQQYHQVHSPKVQAKFSSQPVHHVPSKVFQYVDRKFSTNNDESVIFKGEKKTQGSNENQFSFIKIPAREREQETGPSKYRGTNIPSRSFKYLQYLTDNEAVIDSSNLNNSKPQNASSSSFSPSLSASNNANSKQLNFYHQQQPNASIYKTLSDKNDSTCNDPNFIPPSAFGILEKSNSPPNQNNTSTVFNSNKIGVNSVTFAQPLKQSNASTPNPDLFNPQLAPTRSPGENSSYLSNLISTNNFCAGIELSSNSNSEFNNDNDSSDTVVDTALVTADSIADTPVTYSTANDLVEAIAIELNASKPNTIAQNIIGNEELNANEASSADVANISSEITNSIESTSAPLIRSFSSNNDLINTNNILNENENNENLKQQNDNNEYTSSLTRETKQDEIEVATMNQEQDTKNVSPETTASIFENNRENTQNLVNVVGEVLSNAVNSNSAVHRGELEITASSQYYENFENNEIQTSEF